MGIDTLFTEGSLNLDMAGILFVEAHKHLNEATKAYDELLLAKAKHGELVSVFNSSADDDLSSDTAAEVMHNLGALEKIYSPVVIHFSLLNILLLATSEAYINAVAAHTLSNKQAEHFDKLSPVGKWLFLPRIMKLDFEPDLGSSPLQEFAELVATRNKLIHPVASP